jgi:hypothetical protein
MRQITKEYIHVFECIAIAIGQAAAGFGRVGVFEGVVLGASLACLSENVPKPIFTPNELSRRNVSGSKTLRRNRIYENEWRRCGFVENNKHEVPQKTLASKLEVP